ncbi:MAG: PPC domain-containing protein [Deltaproteobacteria bacterium]|nr:PPC domain-containing protein [Deltaproteobacteria bacterium]
MYTFNKIGLFAFLLGAAACSNKPPKLSPLGNRTVTVNQEVAFDVIASDPDGDDIEFRVVGRPRSASFDVLGRSAHFSWTPLITDARPEPYQISFYIGDKKGGTDSQTISITVTESSVPGEGTPAFLDPFNYQLDLNQTDTLTFKVQARDDNSANVTLRAIRSVEGSTFEQSGAKEATFTWKPTAEQAAARAVWVLTVGAKDETHEEVVQDFTILIRRKEGADPNCPGQGPRIVHAALGEQRGSGDYEVTATVTDTESRVARVDLYYAVVGSDEEVPEQFDSKQMVAAQGSTDFKATIPNPNLTGTATKTVYYYVSAMDDDDANGTNCDRTSFLPASRDSRFSFVAYAPGNTTTCQDDAESNNTKQTAMPLVADTLSGRKICPGKEDWYSIALAAGEGFYALVSSEFANGNIDAELYGPSSGTPVTRGVTTLDVETIEIAPVSQPATYYLRVYGAGATVKNTYELMWEKRTSCAADSQEPNETSAAAKVVSLPFNNAALAICANDKDYFAFDVPSGKNLKIEATFTAADADIDLELRNSSGQFAGSSTGSTGTEKIEKSNVTAGRYKLKVYASDPAKTARYTLSITLTDAPVAQCAGVGEPNNTPATATSLTPNQGVMLLNICQGDVDYYKIHLNAGERLDATTAFTHTAGDLAVQILSPDGAMVIDESDTSAAGTNEEEAFFVACSAGDYLVKVYSPTGQSNSSYTLTPGVTATSSSSCPDGANSSPQTAGAITPGAYRDLLCPGRWDYWRVAGVAAGKTIKVDLAFDNACGNIDVRLYGPAGANPPGTKVAESAQTTGNAESVQYVVPSSGAGDYIIGVKWGSGAGTIGASAYNITVAVTP